ncbi:MAG: 2-oxo acid dehydrogenase subunit E2, partial [Chitinophagaceae bacterium]
MAIVDLVMPKLGESIMEATVLKWHKQPGDAVQQDETVLEIATDKVDSEVPSSADGIIDSILFEVNDVVPIGAVIATIRTKGSEIEKPVASEPATVDPAPVLVTPDPAAPQISPRSEHSPNRFYSPLVMNIATSEGVSMKELEKITGSGNEGRVTKNDIITFIEGRNGSENQKPEITAVEKISERSTTEPSVRPAAQDNTEFIEMDRMGKLVSEHMTKSIQTSVHVTSFSEADVTNLVLWRNRVKTSFEKREGTRITFTPLFVEAIARCIKKFPLINSSVEGTNIILRKDI